MKSLFSKLQISAIGILCLGNALSIAQPWPAKPVRIVTNEPGAGLDFSARLIAQGFVVDFTYTGTSGTTQLTGCAVSSSSGFYNYSTSLLNNRVI